MRKSDTIDFGIDLGTTNSAIAVVEDGDVVVIKSNDGWDITPSAVWMPKPDSTYVGRRARQRVESDPDNAAAEFKLEMGLADARRTFVKAGVELSPQQLSAEVLKSLRADASHYSGEAPEFAVITVPAAFALNQNKATTEAATLAGFNPACPLVQEPTAAAFAYGFRDSVERVYWMVFDFGGGTFDAAVVSKRDGDLRVLNHAGDPYLGGKLIDWALVDRVLAPAAARDLGMAEFHRDNRKWRANFAKLKVAAEDAKIVLSRNETASIMVDLDDDTFEYTLRRDELDSVAEPFYVRAINLCRDALAEASVGVDDIDRLLLVGGQTLAPGLRERLSDPRDGIGIQLDISLDPTTVVARGAAVFASTLRKPETFVPEQVAAGEFVVELAYEPSVTTTTPAVGGRFKSVSEVDWTKYSVTLVNPEGQPPFRSPKIALNAKGAFLTEVDVDPHRTSRFTVELTDHTGAPRKLTPDSLSITHRDVEFGGVRLASSLGIQLADRAFAPMLPKGSRLPTRVREVFRTSSAMQKSDTDAVVRIPVVQGERNRADRNREVGMLEIRPRDVRIDLPAGTEVEVTFEVDASSLVTVIADVPLVQAQFEAEINLDDIRTATPQALQVQLNDAEKRLNALRNDVDATGSPEAQQRVDKIDGEKTLVIVREQVGASKVDAGAAAAAEDRIRDLQADLDDIEDAVQLPTLVKQLEDLLAEADEMVDQAGSAHDRQGLNELRRKATEAISANSSAAMKVQIERVSSFLFELERRSPDWPVRLFYTLQDMLQLSPQASALVQEGKRAIANNDSRGLDAVNQRLIRLLPQNEQEKIIGVYRA